MLAQGDYPVPAMKCQQREKISSNIFSASRFCLYICQNKYLCKICIFTIAINSSRCKYQQFEV